MTESSKVVKTTVKPPNAGKGRPKGSKNKTTTVMKDAMLAVYDDLQAKSGKEHGHFIAWAEDNETEFYKLAAKLLPLQVEASIDASDKVKDWLSQSSN